MPIHLFENYSKRSLFSAFLTGIIFFIGWWLFIDVIATNYQLIHKIKISVLPGVIGTLSLIAVNLIPFKYPTNAIYEQGVCPPFVAYLCLFFAITVSFGALIWGFYIAIEDFILTYEAIWPGIGLLIQNVCIITANLVLKFNKDYTVNFY